MYKLQLQTLKLAHQVMHRQRRQHHKCRRVQLLVLFLVHVQVVLVQVTTHLLQRHAHLAQETIHFHPVVPDHVQAAV